MKKIINTLFVVMLCLFAASCKKEDKQEPFKIVRINFETDGGSEVEKVIIKYNRLLTKPGDPKKSKYTFVDWYSDKGLTKVFDFKQPITEDLTLYAKWTEGVYKVKFESRGGGSVTEQSVKYNDKATAPKVTNPKGYTIKEWRDGEGKPHNFNTAIEDHITLYAIWNMPADLFDVKDGKCNGLKAAYKNTLEYVDIPDNIPGVIHPVLNTDAFKGDSKLVSVSLPLNYRILGGWALGQCSKLKIVLMYGVETIETSALRESGIEYLILPGTVKSVQDSFTLMDKLTEVRICEAPEANINTPLDFQGGGYGFWSSNNIKTIIFERKTAPTVVAGGGPMFEKIENLEKVLVPAVSLAAYKTNWANAKIADKMEGY